MRIGIGMGIGIGIAGGATKAPSTRTGPIQMWFTNIHHQQTQRLSSRTRGRRKDWETNMWRSFEFRISEIFSRKTKRAFCESRV